MRLLQAVEDVNEDQKTYLIPKILHYYNNDISNKTFTLWGLSFKPKTDDMREAPAIEMVKILHERGAKIRAHDPEALNNANKMFRYLLDKSLFLFENTLAQTQIA